MTPPDLVAHADWSTAPGKRWLAVAIRQADGTYRVSAPEPVGKLEDFIERLKSRAPGPRLLVGFDFPVGLPIAYARRAGIDDFREALLGFGEGDWSAFYGLAEHPDEIGLRRPFYPKRPGGTERRHLVDGLGLDDASALLRRCDRPTTHRRAAGALFWTLGPQQSGRAAIVGWRGVIAPALRHAPKSVRLWPFDGDLAALLAEPVTVLAEAYPAEAAVQIGLTPPGAGWSKRSQDDRRVLAPPLFAWAEKRSVSLSDEMARQISTGFGSSADGEDRFDAALGLSGMLEVALGHRPPGPPPDPDVRRVEGWILGLDA
jgi:hypothetical protein